MRSLSVLARKLLPFLASFVLSCPAYSQPYTGNMAPMQSPDAGTLACFNHMNTTAVFPDPSTSRLLASTKRWVAVKNIGARQMVTIDVTSKNEAGMYVGVMRFECLLMGDNVTINTNEYELL